ncbi:hypothetical protein PMZ80_004765 [Knufia obscura]|uniref:Uncharacterized protein n=1 Tax=Knufia obscura TaxID=1635080 RepID=A0ABR0RT21_9EURO|nr:hypothetical protein PMZ80_004765 [Knufia obscura]
MPPIRRYLRISKHSVLECRIFLENPADGPRWLLNPTDPALPRVFEAVRPLVLPKLREENERAKGKGKKKKSVKDVIVKDDFEVSVFLTDVGIRHNLVVKNKTAQDKDTGIKSNTRSDPVILREDSDEETGLAQIPQADGNEDDAGTRDEAMQDDKKKLGFTTTYNGFAIWGKVLCLLVERKGGPGKKSAGSADGGAQALMQEWITATQMQQDDDG